MCLWVQQNGMLPCLLTPWCRVLLEKLTGLHLDKKFPAFYGTRRFITTLTSSRYLSLSWASSIHSILPHPTSCRSNNIISKIKWIKKRIFPIWNHHAMMVYCSNTEKKTSCILIPITQGRISFAINSARRVSSNDCTGASTGCQRHSQSTTYKVWCFSLYLFL